jgi:hypothetical protein
VFFPYHQQTMPFSVLVARRRGGKTVAAVNQMIRAAISNKRKFPEPRYAFIGPLFKQTRRNAWNYFKHYTKFIQGTHTHNSNYEVTLPNGAVIYLDGADNPDAIRGGYLDGAILDEFQDFRPLALETVIMPMLSDYGGWLTITGSAKGRNQLHKALVEAQRDPKSWFTDVIRYSDHRWQDEQYVELLRKRIPENLFKQEYDCNFDAAIEGAYYGKEMEDAMIAGRITSVPYDPTIDVFTVWDIGKKDPTAIWWFQVYYQQLRVIDYYENSGHGVSHYAEVLRKKPYKKTKLDFVPHDARVMEWGTGRTRVEQMIAEGLSPKVVPKVALEDGINAVRMTIPEAWFDAERCEYGLEALRQYQTEFDEDTQTFSNRPRHDWTSHGADAYRYLSLAWREMTGQFIRFSDPLAELLRERKMSDVIPAPWEDEMGSNPNDF